jgi:eukaryotic-like serine/threonine-protein kinase
LEPARWQRLQELFHRALELAPEQRGAAAETWCADDASLLGDLHALLSADDAGLTLLDGGVAMAARSVLHPRHPVPTTIGAYSIRGVLGEGGMGTVYLGEREDIASRVAIKVLRDGALSPARRVRFQLEQRLLAQLEHPGIARLYDAAAMPDGTPYFVMEYVEGVTLTQHCRDADLPVGERLRLFRRVCEAVLHAHSHAIVHRDLKPSNIVVRADGQVKLLDFGISKQLDTSEGGAAITQTALRLMTPAYAAPEQLRGEAVGVYTDVYALGVLLYELLSNAHPFDLRGMTPSQAETLILEQDPQRPSALAAKTTDPPLSGEFAGPRRPAPLARLPKRQRTELDVLCLTAMQKEPERRYRSVEALIRDVDHFQRGEPLEARPDSAAYRLDRFVRRNARQVAAAIAALLLVSALSGFYTVRLAWARDAAVAEAARTERVQQFMLNLFSGGDPSTAPADTLRVVSLLERGVNEAAVLDREPGVQAELFATLGGVYQRLGEFQRADTLLQAALRLRTRISGERHPETARLLVALGALRADQAEFEDAERLTRQGLEILQQIRGAEAGAVRARTALGRVLNERGSYDDAVAILEQALRSSRGDEASVGRVELLNQLANAHFYAGRLEVSDSLTRRVLLMSRSLYGDRHPSVADDMITLGAVQFERGNYVGAETHYREALAIFVGYHGTAHPQTASAMTMLGRALVAQERHGEARELLQQALAVREQVFGPRHPRVASTLNELGTIALATGDHAAAEASYSKMAAIYHSTYGDAHYLLGIAYSNLASVHSDRGDFAAAERLLRDVVRQFATAQSPEHTNTGIAHLKLGRALLRQGKYSDAERELMTGYEILAPQMEPTSRWLQIARQDLVEVHDAVGNTEAASLWRSRLQPPTS